MISLRVANRGWGSNVSPRARAATSDLLSASADDSADDVDTEPSAPADGDTIVEPARVFGERLPPGDEPYINRWSSGHGGPTRDGEVEAGGVPWRIHPIGVVTVGALVVALTYHTVLDTKYQIGHLEPWEWVGLLVAIGFSVWPVGLNGLRVGLDGVASVTKRISMFLAWFVFFVQFFNVVTRYGTRYVEQDILIGEATSLAWQSFAALFLLGANYGIRDGVNPRIDFWWANFSDKRKAWIDFVLHATLFLPFVYMAIRILQPNAALALGRTRDGRWPSGYKVWETWEQAPDADQLPVGHIKALLLVGFVLIGFAVISELIKTGFVIAGRPQYGDLKKRDAPQRIE